MTIAEQWRAALDGVEVRYPDPCKRPVIQLHDDVLLVMVEGQKCNVTGTPFPKFVVSNVRLKYFPGDDLARKWLAAAWAGYLQHEALELVSWRGTRPLDPHTEPYPTHPFNRGLYDGLPTELTPTTLRRTLEVVMSPSAADELIRLGGTPPQTQA